MDKEFEALKTIKIKCHPNSNPNPIVDEALEIIESALTELEQIKEANPSEAIKCLNKIEGFMRYYEVNDTYKDELTTIKQALLKQLSGSQYTNIYIDEAVKPSEAMECLEKLPYMSQGYGNWREYYNTIKQALLKAQELEKENTEYKEVLTLIKNKMVDLDVIAASDGYIMYNAKMGDRHPDTPFKDFALTEDEFNKVKRYFGNE